MAFCNVFTSIHAHFFVFLFFRKRTARNVNGLFGFIFILVYFVRGGLPFARRQNNNNDVVNRTMLGQVLHSKWHC